MQPVSEVPVRIPANDVIEAERKSHVSPEELRAYVEGGLSPERRGEIEGFLACNPDLAAQVMTALHMHGRSGARRRPPVMSTARWQAACVMLAAVLAGTVAWTVNDEISEQARFASGARAAPLYVDDAVMSERATMLRKQMDSQVETPKLDINEIRTTMNLRLPALPADWKVVDVQVYPSDDGPAVNLMIDTPTGTLSLFAVRADARAPRTPTVARSMGKDVAYWEINDSAYALMGAASREELLARAAELSREALL